MNSGLRNFVPKSCLKKLYFAFVYPHLVFGIEVYANSYKSIVNKLSKLNNSNT